jgi:hypothetical protein
VFKEYDVQKRYYGLGMEFGDVRDFLCESRYRIHDEASNKRYIQGHDHCLKLKLPREKDPSPTHHANHTYGGADIELVLYRIFLSLSTWKKRIC